MVTGPAGLMLGLIIGLAVGFGVGTRWQPFLRSWRKARKHAGFARRHTADLAVVLGLGALVIAGAAVVAYSAHVSP